MKHYDWLLAGIGALALIAAAAFFFTAVQEDADEATAATLRELDRKRQNATGVKEVDFTGNQQAMRQIRKPVELAALDDGKENFLTSERRVKCRKCGKAITADYKLVESCPFCKEKREIVKVEQVVDSDGDGMPDSWETKSKLNPKDAADAATDKDGDGFTNLEEFKAKTDPVDAHDHPPYVDSLKLVLPLKETYLPFVFRKANQIPGGWRLEFLDPKLKNVKRGETGIITAKIGEEIVAGKNHYGYVVKGYTAKSEKRKIKGTQGLTKTVDISEATVERKSDGKVITMVIQEGKTVKPVAIDVQATLVYERMGTKNFEVVNGSKIELNGEKFTVSEVTPVSKGAKLTLENVISGKKTTLSALE